MQADSKGIELMGTGEHGGFGLTEGSGSNQRFHTVLFCGQVKVEGEIRDVGRKVYQRNDIDFEYFDGESGMTNLERMLSGRPPIGNDGKPVQLHHVIQKESGPVVEIRETTHREYKRILHGLRGSGNSFRNDATLRKQFNNFRKVYWRWRAKQHMEGKE